jgi:hypothetical protein
MDWLIIFVLGGLGSGWPRGPDDPWPDNCPPCSLIIGGLAAILINVLAPIDVGTGFLPMAVISFAAGYTGARLVSGAGRMIAGKAKR